MQKKRTEKIVAVAVLSAVALVLYLLEFPLLPNNYLKMDFSDLPALIGGVLYGPVAGILITALEIFRISSSAARTSSRCRSSSAKVGAVQRASRRPARLEASA